MSVVEEKIIRESDSIQDEEMLNNIYSLNVKKIMF